MINKEWWELIGEEFKEDYFVSMVNYIKERKTHVKVYPNTMSETLQIFRNTSPSTIKVVIIGQDPYPDGSYDGRAFSNFPWVKNVSPSLSNILKEVKSDIWDGRDIKQSPSLERWEKQRVMLINRVLTVEELTPGSHRKIGWEVVVDNAINKLSTHKQHIVFMLWGNEAQKILPSIQNQENHLILTAGHPSPLSANQTNGTWFGCKHFSKANDYLLKNKLDFIEW
jgi:uracil-DNA glycosylase